MRRVYKAIMFLGALMIVNVSIAAGANLGSDQDRVGALCFEETEKVARGIDPESLSTTPCRRALRVEPLGQMDRSAMLYNRGIIQRAKGDLVAARASFEKAARLSRTVDKRNLALAEVAREQGDYHAALKQYDLLIESGFGVGSDSLQAAVFARRQQTDSIYVASVEKAQACAGCHGADGIGANPQYPTLAGRESNYLEHALRQFKNSERQNAVMTAQAAQIADEDIPLLADYFASVDVR